MNHLNVLYIIAARGGSKGVPRKNIREIAGLPLIAYKIIAANRSQLSGRVIVSTEDREIADIARQYGAETPFVRPKELASDTASSVDVVLHAMNWIMAAEDRIYDYICLLEPSSPFLSYKDLDEIKAVLETRKPDTLLGMKAVDVNSCFIHELDEQGGLSLFDTAIQNMKSVRRQDQKPQYTMNGCLYIAKWDYFIKNRSFHSQNSVPYIMDEIHSVEIDSMLNLAFAEFLVQAGMINIDDWNMKG